MAKGNNFEFGGSNAGGDMTPEEMLAARGFYAEPSKEGKSFYVVHGKDGKGKKIPTSEGITGLGDVPGRFLGQGDLLYSPHELRCRVVGRGVLSGIAEPARRVKRRIFG